MIGMFVPSFITGTLIARFGVERMVRPGFALRRERNDQRCRHHALAFSGSGLVLLGVGWNFGFMGATTW